MTLARVARHLACLVEAACTAHLRTLDCLAVDAPGTGSRLPGLEGGRVPGLDPDLRAQGRIDPLPSAILTPFGEVIVNRNPRAKLLGEHAPLATRPIAVEDAVDNLPQVNRSRTASPRGGNPFLQYSPLFIR